MDSKCTHKKDSLHVFLDAKSDLQKKPNRTGGFFKTEPKPKPNRTRGFYQNRTETEPNLKNPFRTSLVVSSDIVVIIIEHTQEWT